MVLHGIQKDVKPLSLQWYMAKWRAFPKCSPYLQSQYELHANSFHLSCTNQRECWSITKQIYWWEICLISCSRMQTWHVQQKHTDGKRAIPMSQDVFTNPIFFTKNLWTHQKSTHPEKGSLIVNFESMKKNWDAAELKETQQISMASTCCWSGDTGQNMTLMIPATPRVQSLRFTLAQRWSF